MPKFKKGDQVSLKENKYLYGYTEIEAGTVVTVIDYLGGNKYQVSFNVEEGTDWYFLTLSDEMEKI